MISNIYLINNAGDIIYSSTCSKQCNECMLRFLCLSDNEYRSHYTADEKLFNEIRGDNEVFPDIDLV